MQGMLGAQLVLVVAVVPDAAGTHAAFGPRVDPPLPSRPQLSALSCILSDAQ